MDEDLIADDVVDISSITSGGSTSDNSTAKPTDSSTSGSLMGTLDSLFSFGVKAYDAVQSRKDAKAQIEADTEQKKIVIAAGQAVAEDKNTEYAKMYTRVALIGGAVVLGVTMIVFAVRRRKG